MSFRFHISAGEFFELIRPTVLMLSALASIWVLASARKHRFPLYLAIMWALGTLFFPLVTLPLYLFVRFIWKRRESAVLTGSAGGETIASSTQRWRIAIPVTYAVVVLSIIGFYLYWDYQSVDAYLARAAQAKVGGKRGKTIDEYRSALKLEDNPHTRKLLAIELVGAGDWTGALTELREAEQGGEPDDLIAFYIATLLDALNLRNQATIEYERFLQSEACTQPMPDDRCSVARARVHGATPRNPSKD